MRRITYTGEGGHRVSVDLDKVQAMTAISKEMTVLWMDNGMRLEVRANFDTVLEQMANTRKTT